MPTPGQPEQTSTPDQNGCVKTRPENWIIYRVRGGDTISSLANATGITTQELIRVNCIANPNLLRVGDELFLPRLPSSVNPSPTGGGPGQNPTPPPAGPTNPPPSDDDDDDDDDDDNSGSGSHDDDDDDDNSGSG